MFKALTRLFIPGYITFEAEVEEYKKGKLVISDLKCKISYQGFLTSGRLTQVRNEIMSQLKSQGYSVPKLVITEIT